MACALLRVPAIGMTTLVKGIHHITLCPGSAQEDLDFYSQVLGQRLVKQTVLMDGRIPIYHFYWGNADAEVGSIATSFPYSRRAGRPGSGQVSVVSYAIPAGTAAFWRDHFACHGLEHSDVQERFGLTFVRVKHPAGMHFEVMETAERDTRCPWVTPRISADVATRGFFGAVMSVRSVAEQEQFLVEAMGFCKIGVDGAYHRYQTHDRGPGSIIDLQHEPDRPPGTWSFGSGTAHHIAFNVDTDEALVAQKALYEELGYTDASDIKDRYYFHSMYVRSPGGILVECTANVPGGFYLDETPEDLGRHLNLPPWYEGKREDILTMLEPVVVPESNRPRPGSMRTPRPLEPAGMTPSGVPLTRTRAEFITEKP
jgi:glyoxalase family protein